MRDCEGLGIDTSRGTLLAVDPDPRRPLRADARPARWRASSTSPPSRPNRSSRTSPPWRSRRARDDGRGIRMSYWFADRHVDNGPTPAENDGLLHEVAIPAGGRARRPPSVTLTADGRRHGLGDQPGANATDDIGVTRVASPSPAPDRHGHDRATAGASPGTRGPRATATTRSWRSPRTAVGTPARRRSARTVARCGHAQRRRRAGADDASDPERDRPAHGRPRARLDKAPRRPPECASPVSRSRAARRITRASVQFNADELDRAAASVTIRAQAADNSGASPRHAVQRLQPTAQRRRASAGTIPVWNVFGAPGPEQRTPDLRAVLQEVVDRPGWPSGNASTIADHGDGPAHGGVVRGRLPAGAEPRVRNALSPPQPDALTDDATLGLVRDARPRPARRGRGRLLPLQEQRVPGPLAHGATTISTC